MASILDSEVARRSAAAADADFVSTLHRQLARSPQGLVSAGAILGLWGLSLAALLPLDLQTIPPLAVAGFVAVRTFLHTGLFITAHDAMHGAVIPGNRPLNDRIGAVCTWLYCLLPYRTLLAKHGLHHRHPATVFDPDFHGGPGGMLGWYARFMASYLTDRTQALLLVFGMGALTALALGVLGLSPLNLLLFWIAPLVLSSVQLFFFGTYLPHREESGGWQNRHRAKSLPLAHLWSFLACYHFGYHWEHHEYPQLPWFALPAAYDHSRRR